MSTDRSDSKAGAIAPLFSALGDGTRLQLIERLSLGGPASISALTEGSGMTRQAITKHLHVMAGAGLVLDAVRGRERLWRVEPSQLDQARAYLDAVARRWDEALKRLKLQVESDMQTDP